MTPEITKLLSERFLIPPEVARSLIDIDGEGIEQAVALSSITHVLPTHANSQHHPDFEIKLEGCAAEVDDLRIVYFRTLDASEFASSEIEGDVKKHESYARYLKMSQDGLIPPPILAIMGRSGNLVSVNRRRLLVAQELKLPIGAWIESDTGVNGKTLTIGEFNAAKAELTAALNITDQHKPCANKAGKAR